MTVAGAVVSGRLETLAANRRQEIPGSADRLKAGGWNQSFVAIARPGISLGIPVLFGGLGLGRLRGREVDLDFLLGIIA
jgi:hypothetical protein